MGGAGSCLNFVCHVLLKLISGLSLSEQRLRSEWGRAVDGTGGEGTGREKEVETVVSR